MTGISGAFERQHEAKLYLRTDLGDEWEATAADLEALGYIDRDRAVQRATWALSSSVLDYGHPGNTPKGTAAKALLQLIEQTIRHEGFPVTDYQKKLIREALRPDAD